jgi:hypothetical protein
MKKIKCWLAAACVAAQVCASAATQPGDVVFSDQFDTLPLGLNLTSLPGGWSVAGGTIDVIGAPGDDPRPGHGRYIDLQGSSGHPGSLSIEIPVETSGTYAVEFLWSGNSRGNAGAIGVDTGPAEGTDGLSFIIGVTADTPFLQSGHGTGLKNKGSFLLTFFTPPFVDTPQGRVFPDTGLLLDGVTVTFLQAIPEPSTFVLLLAGFGALALGRHCVGLARVGGGRRKVRSGAFSTRTLLCAPPVSTLGVAND